MKKIYINQNKGCIFTKSKGTNPANKSKQNDSNNQNKRQTYITLNL